jgi:hypothetical protein
MGERQRRQEAVAFRIEGAIAADLGIPAAHVDEIAVGQDAALWRAGGAGGEHHHRFVAIECCGRRGDGGRRLIDADDRQVQRCEGRGLVDPVMILRPCYRGDTSA